MNENDSIPFEYKIEKSRINPQTGHSENINVYVYRFTVNADYKPRVPLGFYEIGQKGGDILQGNEGTTLVRVKK